VTHSPRPRASAPRCGLLRAAGRADTRRGGSERRAAERAPRRRRSWGCRNGGVALTSRGGGGSGRGRTPRARAPTAAGAGGRGPAGSAERGRRAPRGAPAHGPAARRPRHRPGLPRAALKRRRSAGARPAGALGWRWRVFMARAAVSPAVPRRGRRSLGGQIVVGGIRTRAKSAGTAPRGVAEANSDPFPERHAPPTYATPASPRHRARRRGRTPAPPERQAGTSYQ
jgi:hypothetical protein